MEQDITKMNDHDLLVSMHGALGRAVIDIKSLDDKVTEFNNNYARKSDVDKAMNDLQTDVKWLQRIAYGGLGVVGALELYLNYMHKWNSL